MALFENLPYGGQYLPQAINGLGTLAGLGAGAWALSGGPQRVADRRATATGRLANNSRAMQRKMQDMGFSGNFFGSIADRNAAKSDWYQNWYLGKRLNEGGPLSNRDPVVDPNNVPWNPNRDPNSGPTGGGISNAINTTRDTIGNYYGDPTSIQNWQDRITALTGQNAYAANWMNPGEQSIGGNYYSPYETQALGGLQSASGQTLQGVGNQVGLLGSQYSGQSTSPLASAIEQRSMAALDGGMTPASQAQYQAINQQMATTDQQAMNQINRNASQNMGLWGSGRLDQQNALALQSQQQRLSTLQGLMSTDAQQAMNYALQDKSLNNAALSIASDIYGKQAGNTLAANQAILGHVQQAGQQYLQQTNLQLEQQFGNFDRQLQLAMQQGNIAQYKNNYNLQNRQLASDTTTSLIDSFFGGGGILPFFNNEWWKQYTAGQGGLASTW